MSEWISVKDKLPEKQQSVIVVTTDGNSIYVAWIEEFGMEDKPIWQYSWCCGCYVSGNVTHWMQLPSLPKDNKQ